MRDAPEAPEDGVVEPLESRRPGAGCHFPGEVAGRSLEVVVTGATAPSFTSVSRDAFFPCFAWLVFSTSFAARRIAASRSSAVRMRGAKFTPSRTFSAPNSRAADAEPGYSRKA